VLCHKQKGEQARERQRKSGQNCSLLKSPILGYLTLYNGIIPFTREKKYCNWF
jgi:hypothetical protein